MSVGQIPIGGFLSYPPLAKSSEALRPEGVACSESKGSFYRVQILHRLPAGTGSCISMILQRFPKKTLWLRFLTLKLRVIGEIPMITATSLIMFLITGSTFSGVVIVGFTSVLGTTGTLRSFLTLSCIIVWGFILGTLVSCVLVISFI